MKHLLIIFLFLSFAHPVFAARQVKGTVPNVQPLQPPAVNVKANLSGNIQFRDTSHEGQFSTSAPDQSSPAEAPGPSAANSGIASVPSESAGHTVLVALLFAAVLGGAAFGINRLMKNDK